MDLQYPLSGIKVLDMSRVLAGPFAGRMLCDLGAEVVKLEPPEKDVTRTLGKKIGTISGYFHQQNAGKQNISIELNTHQGIELVKELVASADILVENFRPGVMKKFGLDWEALKQINPSLIMLSISGFGQTGPEANRAAYAPIIHAETGSVLRQSNKSEGKPVELCMSIADTNAGLHGLVGILAALHLRASTGLGQHIDIAMVDSMLATDDQTQMHMEGSVANMDGAEVWDATGGPVMIAADTRFLWRQLHTVFGLVDPSPDNVNLETKVANRRAVIGAFLTSFENRQALTDALDKAKLVWGGVNRTEDYLAESATLEYRNSIVKVPDKHGSTRNVFQSPYRFSDALSGVRDGATYLGEDNHDVIRRWTSRTDQEIADLTERGVLVTESEP